jgi:hypothetical protein
MTQRGIAVVARAASGALVAIGLCTLLTGSALAASAPRTTAATKHAARRHPARAHRAPGAAGLGMRTFWLAPGRAAACPDPSIVDGVLEKLADLPAHLAACGRPA